MICLCVVYVNGEKEGIILEKPLIMGENGRNDECSSSSYPRLDVSDEINLALKSCSKATSNYDMTKDMKRLGMER